MLFGALPVIFVMAVISVWMMMSGLRQSNTGQALIGAAGSLLFPIAAPMAIRVYQTRRTVVPVIHAGHNIDGEIALPIPRWRWFSLIAGLFSLVITVAAILFLFALTFPDSATMNYRLRSPLVVPLLLVVVLIGSWLLARVLYAATRVQGLWLTSTGVYMSNGLMYQAVDWDDILEVQAASRPRFATIKLTARPGAVDLVWKSWWIRKSSHRWLVEIYTLEFDMDSALLYHTIRYYWKNPEFRSEFESDAAVKRVRRGRVLDTGNNRRAADS
ncbi:hypothetical protein OHB26_26555 [Nocardia sp. NBC_01503]|uniref:hypothetical protein n=1 Tax=Nocardia sp. NBC_01503 TaxID=2975997 RepID=UPI002E7C26B8|nr:hypothetical protein [Nocardia sp. NBC_01503]WTL30477.1 hypothetical protein OHB26_26555 [Nocardia sp. NBC_01503]